VSEPSTIQWRYDAADSWLLRVLAHGFVAGLGGTFLLAAVGVVLALPALVGSLGVGPLALVVLLALVGGPASLLYLWPMIRDPDQRPRMGEAVGDGAHPWTPASTAVATVVGATGLMTLIALDVPVTVLYAVVGGSLASPMVVALFSTDARVESGRLTAGGSSVPLAQIETVRTVSVGRVVVCWLSHARGTGLLVPRLLTVPAGTWPAVRDHLSAAVGETPERPDTDPFVRAVLVVAGGLFLGTGVLAAPAASEAFVGLYVGVVLGLLGILFVVAGWRGV
jgi:hypothetical protein